MSYALQLLLVLAALVEAPPPRGDLGSVTDQEIIRALSVLLTQDRRDQLATDDDGVSFRRREQFDEEERKLMEVVESERQQRQQSLSKSLLNISAQSANKVSEFIVRHLKSGVEGKIDKIVSKKGSHPD